jgi:hypothetical protein
MVTVFSFFQHKFFKIIVGLYIAIYLAIWAFSSPITKHYLTPILTEHNLTINDNSSIRFNPFLMRITVNDLTLSQLSDKTEEKVLALDKLIVQVSLWQVFFDKLMISQFELSDGYLRVTHNQGELNIAGIAIPAQQEEKPATEQEQTVDLSAYQALLPELLINQFHIDIVNNNKDHQFVIEQLQLSAVQASQRQQQGQLLLAALLDDTALTINLDANLIAAQGDINSKIKLNNYPLKHLASYAEQLTDLNGTLSLASEQTLSLLDDGIKLHLKQTNIKHENIVVGLPEQRLSLVDFTQNITDLKLMLAAGKITQLTGSASMHLNDAQIIAKQTDEKILSFEQLALDDISFHLDTGPKVQITELLLNKLAFSQKQLSSPIEIAEDILKSLPPVAQLQQIKVSDIQLTEKNLAIDSITLDSLTTDVLVDKEKNIINLVALGDKTEAEEQAVIEETETKTQVINDEQVSKDMPAKSDAFTFSLNNFSLINKNEITLADYSVDPIYKRTLFIDTLTLGALSNKEPEQQQQTPFVLVGRSNKYANFNLTGFIQPFATVKNYHIEGDLKEFSLPAVSSYMKESTGIEVKTGQLNTALNITLTDEELDGNIVILLQGLETGLVNTDEAGSLIEQGALPLNMAMGMLKDGDGNLELDVPLSGSTSDPSFGIHSIITLITQKAVVSATQDYLMTTFVPYANIVSIAVSAGQFALKLRFDDLPYQAKQIEPDEKQAQYLQQFIALMQDKADTRVSICSVSTPADIGLTLGQETTNKQDIKRLKAIGEQRQEALKDYLVEQGKISSSRILFCKPQVDSSQNALPRIAISV